MQTTDDGEFHGGLLDLDLYVPAGFAFSKQPIEERVSAFYERIAIHAALLRGEARFHEIAESYRSIDDFTELANAMLATKATSDRTQSNVILTESLEVQGLPLWGIASGIPGAATRTGTPASGVALALLGSAAEDAYALEHEAGHFVGLSHTTELQLGLHDPLSDTPICANMNDPFKCPDANHTMFPQLVIPASDTALSPAQSRIFGSNPIVRAFAEKTGFKPRMKDRAPGEPPSARVRGLVCHEGVLFR